MNENRKLTVPTLSVKVVRKKISVRQKIVRIVLFLCVCVFSFTFLRSPEMAVGVYGNLPWVPSFTEMVLYLLFATALIFSAACLVCEVIGYTQLKFTMTAALVTAALCPAASWWHWKISLNTVVGDSVMKYLPYGSLLGLTVFAVVFLFGKFVLFRKPHDEQAKK